MKSRWIQLTLELTAWVFFLLFPVLLFPSMRPFYQEDQLNPVLTGIILTNSLLICFYYFNLYLAIPKFYFKGLYKQFVYIILGMLLLIILILQVNPGFNPLPSPPFKYARAAFIGSILIRFIMIFLFSLGMASLNRLRIAQKEKLASELALLRAQVNPHFLFNTLNSIYALTVTKNENAPAAVSQLAAIMRYSLESAQCELVPLTQELNHIAAYMELEKIRLNDKTELEYKVLGNSDGLQIAPMLLLPLVENCFKHGVSTREIGTITIEITIHNNHLSISTRNRIIKNDQTGGNGLSNLIKRLNLLYPAQHFLTHAEKNGYFITEMNLQL